MSSDPPKSSGMSSSTNPPFSATPFLTNFAHSSDFLMISLNPPGTFSNEASVNSSREKYTVSFTAFGHSAPFIIFEMAAILSIVHETGKNGQDRGSAENVLRVETLQ